MKTKTKLKKLVRSAKCLVLGAALCAVGLAAFAEEPDAVQLWKDGPYFATSNLGTSEVAEHPEYGALYTFDDAGTAVKSLLGDEWRVPSEHDLEGLLDPSKCTKAKVTDDAGEFLGWTFTGAADGYTDKSIFLPAAGYDGGDDRDEAGDLGNYWSSKANGDDFAWLLFFDGDNHAGVNSSGVRSDGLSVRAVRDTPPTPTPPEPSDEEVVATAEATFVLGPALAVANVKTATHWPWDGKIDVTCDLTGSGKVQLSAALTTNGVTVCTAKAENLTGETEIDLDQVGGVTNGVKFVWNAKADCPAGFNSKDAKVKVTAKKFTPLGGVQLWEGGPIFAECNVGAEKPEEAGYYFWWGDTVGYKHDGSKWVSVDGKGTTIEFSSSDTTANQTFDHDNTWLANNKWIDGSGNLVVSDDETNRDAAREHLGAPWRMPTYAELKGLVDECDCLAINTSGTEYKGDGDTFVGWRVTGRGDYSGNSIFLPAVGGGDGSDLRNAGERGEYWSSTPYSDLPKCAWELYFHASTFSEDYSWRCYGVSVRAVRDAK